MEYSNKMNQKDQVHYENSILPDEPSGNQTKYKEKMIFYIFPYTAHLTHKSSRNRKTIQISP